MIRTSIENSRVFGNAKIPRITDDSGEDKDANQITGDGENISARRETDPHVKKKKYFRFDATEIHGNDKHVYVCQGRSIRM